MFKAPPVKHGNAKRILEIPSKEELSSSSSTGESCADLSESDSCKSFEEDNNLETTLFRNTSLLRIRKLLNMDPRVYLDIISERISFIHLLGKLNIAEERGATLTHKLVPIASSENVSYT